MKMMVIGSNTGKRVVSLAFVVANGIVATNAFGAGFSGAANGLSGLFEIVRLTIVAGSVVAGLSFVGAGVHDMVKKGGKQGEEISWTSIGYKIFGGSLLMALTWVANTAIQLMGKS